MVTRQQCGFFPLWWTPATPGISVWAEPSACSSKKLPHIPKQLFAYGCRRELQLWFLSGVSTDLTRPQDPYANHPFCLIQHGHCQSCLPQVLFLASPVITKQIIRCKLRSFSSDLLIFNKTFSHGGRLGRSSFTAEKKKYTNLSKGMTKNKGMEGAQIVRHQIG